MRKNVIASLSILSVLLLLSACKDQCFHNGHEFVDLGLSVKWATCNVGAEKPENNGGYYAWGEIRSKVIYSWKNYRFRESGNSYSDIKFSKYDGDVYSVTLGKNVKKRILDAADDVANLEWGGDWRMPTKEEIEELTWNCDWVWTTLNGVNGIRITSKVDGYTDRSIFIPASGYKDDSKQIQTGKAGYLWSSTNTDMKARANIIFFYSHGSHLDETIRSCIDEAWNWYDTDGDYVFSELPQSLTDKLRKYFDSGKVDLDSIPESIYNEYRSYISTTDWGVTSYFYRYIGMPVRPVCP